MQSYNKLEKFEQIAGEAVSEVELLLEHVVEHPSDDAPHAEKALWESREKLRLITDSAHDAIIMVNGAGNISFWNKAAETIFGFSAQEALGKDAHLFLLSNQPSGDDPFLLKPGDAPMHGKTLELTGVKKDGGQFPAELSFSFVRLADQWTGIAIVRDIAGRKVSETGIKASQEKLELIQYAVDNAGDMVFWTDSKAQLLSVNKAACSRLGYREHELVKMTNADIDPFHPIETWLDHWEKLKVEKRLRFETCHRDRAGKIYPVEVLANYVVFGGKEYSCGFVRDISERKNAEAVLRESEERFRSAFENAAIGMDIVGLDGAILKVNKAFCEMAGYSEEEMLAMNIADISHDDDMQINLMHRRRVACGDADGFRMEKRYRHKAGHLIWAILNVSAVRDAQGEPLYYIGQMQNITDRKRSEDQVRAINEKLRITFENAPIGMALTSLDGRFLQVNKHLCDMFGYNEMELLKKKFSEITYAPDIQENLDERKLLLDGTKDVFQLEKRYINKQGQIIWGLLSTSVVRDHRGNPQYFIGQVQDITARKKSEKALRTSEERYHRLFEYSPVPLWEMDFSEIKMRIDALKSQGIYDFYTYYQKHPEEVAASARLVEIKDVNQALLSLYGAKNKAQLSAVFDKLFSGDVLNGFQKELVALAEGSMNFEHENVIRTLRGEKRHVVIRTFVVPGNENSFSRVLRSSDDITERIEAEEHRRHAKELSEALNRINLVINSTLDMDQILTQVLSLATQATGCDAAAILTKEQNSWRFSYLHGLPEENLGKLLVHEENKCAIKVSGEKEMVISNPDSEGEEICCGLVEKFGIKSFLSAPLFIRGEVVGVLDFFLLYKNYEFSQEQIDFGVQLANSLSLAMENSRLYAQEHEIAEERKKAKELSDALNSINTAINSTFENDEIMRRVVEEAAKALGADSAGIALREDDFWVTRHVFGMPKECLGRRLPYYEATATVEATSTRRPVAISNAYVDERVNNELMKKAGVVSLLIIPLIVRDEIIGAMSFNYHARKEFTESQIDFSKKLALSVSLALDNARLFKAEQKIAHTLQEALLVMPHKLSGLEFGCLYCSAGAADVGGDFYDLIELDEERVGIVIGDVSGKGLEAATLTSLIKNTIKAYAYEHLSPAQVMTKTNQAVHKNVVPGMFASVFFGVLNKTNGEMAYSGCGHPPGLIKRKDGTITLLNTDSPVVGAFADMDYVEGQEVLNHGEHLILYTDGATEARAQREFFGEERLLAAIQDLTDTDADKLPHLIFNKIQQYVGGQLVDDIALLVVALSKA